MSPEEDDLCIDARRALTTRGLDVQYSRGITVVGLASTLVIHQHDARRVRGVHTTRYHAEPAASVRHSDRYSKDQTTHHRTSVNPRENTAARDGE